MKTHDINSFRGRRASDRLKKKAWLAFDIVLSLGSVAILFYFYFGR